MLGCAYSTLDMVMLRCCLRVQNTLYNLRFFLKESATVGLTMYNCCHAAVLHTCLTSSLLDRTNGAGRVQSLLCRLEGVLYSLTSCSKELLQLRQPALADLQQTCAWASHACSKPSTAKPVKQGKENVSLPDRPECHGDQDLVLSA